MKYMLLIYSNPAGWEALTEQERAALAEEHDALTRELVESGEWLAGAPLADPVNTRTVRVRDGAAEVTDGPFVEAKEHLAGYDLVDCESRERAVEIASRIPGSRLVAVEVRPLMEGAGMEM
ncbi:YciI family protein [Nocardiopsis sp. LOL_012]|uniref:YciI family protein n=1 Tax=Nocardiopsis sp. LOL_012 TaxID=3345409 RepID=UPI003A886D42